MLFEKYINKVIDDFQEDIKICSEYPQDLTENEKEYIKEIFKKHKKCYENCKKDFDNNNEELFTSTIYGDNISAAIECMICNEVLIDDESLKEKSMEE